MNNLNITFCFLTKHLNKLDDYSNYIDLILINFVNLKSILDTVYLNKFIILMNNAYFVVLKKRALFLFENNKYLLM